MDIQRTSLALACLVGIVAAQGCGNQDPGQPGVGSISIKAKSAKNDDASPAEDRAARFAKKPR